MFLLISEMQATLPDICEFFSKPCLSSHLQAMQPENLQLWMLREAFATYRVLFVWGFQDVSPHPVLCKQTQLSVQCVQDTVQSGNSWLWRKYQFLFSQTV